MAGVDDHRTFIYRIDAENKIIFVNREWFDFAAENQAPELSPEYVLGQPLDRFIAGWETKHLYELIYEHVRQKQRDVHIHFSCDSPSMRRSFRMRVALLEGKTLEFNIGVVKIEPIPSRSILDNSIAHSSQVIVICSWCKRIQVNGCRWVEIERATEEKDLFGATPPTLTHDVCPECLEVILGQIHKP